MIVTMNLLGQCLRASLRVLNATTDCRAKGKNVCSGAGGNHERENVETGAEATTSLARSRRTALRRSRVAGHRVASAVDLILTAK